jgi:hypothetical protein
VVYLLAAVAAVAAVGGLSHVVALHRGTPAGTCTRC